MIERDLTGFVEDFSGLLLNPFPAALKFILSIFELHYPDFPILDGFLQLLVQVLQDAQSY